MGVVAHRKTVSVAAVCWDIWYRLPFTMRLQRVRFSHSIMLSALPTSCYPFPAAPRTVLAFHLMAAIGFLSGSWRAWFDQHMVPFSLSPIAGEIFILASRFLPHGKLLTLLH